MGKGYSTCSVCLCVCVCVCVFSLFWHLVQSGIQTAVSATSARYGHEIKKGFFLKMLRSEVMASFAFRDSPRRNSSALELAFSTTEYSKVV